MLILKIIRFLKSGEVGVSSDRLEFYRKFVKEQLDIIKETMSSSRYSLYIKTVEECQDLGELMEMAELDLQIDMSKYTMDIEARLKNELNISMADVKKLSGVTKEVESKAEAMKQELEEQSLEDLLWVLQARKGNKDFYQQMLETLEEERIQREAEKKLEEEDEFRSLGEVDYEYNDQDSDEDEDEEDEEDEYSALGEEDEEDEYSALGEEDSEDEYDDLGEDGFISMDTIDCEEDSEDSDEEEEADADEFGQLGEFDEADIFGQSDSDFISEDEEEDDEYEALGEEDIFGESGDEDLGYSGQASDDMEDIDRNSELFEEQLDLIESIAEDVRSAIENVHTIELGFEEDEECATFLCDMLRDAGVEADVVSGWCCTDYEEEPYAHSWVVTTGGTIVDVTADQFNDSMEEDDFFERVIVTDSLTPRMTTEKVEQEEEAEEEFEDPFDSIEDTDDEDTEDSENESLDPFEDMGLEDEDDTLEGDTEEEYFDPFDTLGIDDDSESDRHGSLPIDRKNLYDALNNQGKTNKPRQRKIEVDSVFNNGTERGETTQKMFSMLNKGIKKSGDGAKSTVSKIAKGVKKTQLFDIDGGEDIEF